MIRIKGITTLICLGVLFSGVYLPIFAQTTSTKSVKSTNNFVKWQMLSGKNNEFFFAVPENSVVYTDRNFYMDSNRYARVDYVKTMISSLGNTVLQVDLYDGAVKDVQKVLIDDLKENVKREEKGKETQLEIKEVEKNGFRTSNVVLNYRGCIMKKQFFRNQDRLYILTSASRDAENQISKDFFASVRLVNQSKVLSPNMNDKVEELTKAKMTLPRAFGEKFAELTESPDFLEPDKLDKNVFVVYQPSPQIPAIDSKFDKTFNQMKVKVEYLANGKIGKVEAITKTSRAIEKQVLEVSKEIKFLPAEKNGKAVSTYGTVNFSLTFR